MAKGYRPNPGFEQELYRSAVLKEPMQEQAEKVKGAAQDLSGGFTYYGQMLTADRIEMDGGRWTAYVDAHDFKSHWLEWGSINNAAGHILQRAVEMALRLNLGGG